MISTYFNIIDGTGVIAVTAHAAQETFGEIAMDVCTRPFDGRPILAEVWLNTLNMLWRASGFGGLIILGT